MQHPRVAILGNSGSGKSTLAKTIAAELDCESLDLDTIAWEPGQIAVARAQADAEAELTAFCEGRPRWVIEGCYGDLIAAALVWRPELILLDPDVDACVRNCMARPWEPHKYASKAEQDQRLAFLLEWVRGYDARDGPMSGAFHRAVFEQYDGPKRRVG